jgi:intracellular septation protein
MLTALRTFVSDLLSTIVFLVVFSITANAPLAIGISIGAGVLQVVVEKLRGRPVATMQWASMGLVIVFGSASLYMHDTRLMMIKPSIVAVAVAAVMLQKGWMDRYLPQEAHDHLPRGLIIASGYAWSALIFALGVANFIVAMTCSFKMWAWFSGVVPLSAQIAAFLLQYATFRIVGRLRARRTVAA